MLPQIERAFLLSPGFKQFPALKGYDRIYFGCEYCEKLIPSEAELERVVTFSTDWGLKLSFLTPFVTETSLKKLSSLFHFLSQVKKRPEIIINDFGVLEFIREKGFSFDLALGRLLNRQKRCSSLQDPAFEKDLRNLHFRQSHTDRPEVTKILKNFGVKRIEFDNLFQGLSRKGKALLSGSVYYPFIYVSTSRLCATSKLCSHNLRLRKNEECKKECSLGYIKLQGRSYNKELYLKGNSYFLYNPALPEDLSDNKIDRIVFEPDYYI